MDKWVIRIVEMDRTFYAGSLTHAERVVTHSVELASRFSTFDAAVAMRTALNTLFPTARHILIDPIRIIV